MALALAIAGCDTRDAQSVEHLAQPDPHRTLSEPGPQHDQPAAAGAAKERPFLVIEAQQPLSAGTVAFGSELVRTLSVSNVSEKPLDVAVAGVSCSCTAADFDRSRLEPGDTAKLTVTVHVTIPGAQTQSVLIHARHPNDRPEDEPLASETIPISFTPDRSFEVFPPSITFETLTGSPTRHHVRFTAFAEDPAAGAPIDATIWNDADGWNVLGIDEARPGIEGPQWIITVEGRWDTPREIDDWLIIHSSDPSTPEWSVRLAGRVVPPVTITPSAVIARLGEPTRLAITPQPGCSILSVAVAEHDERLSVEVISEGDAILVTPLSRGRHQVALAIESRCAAPAPGSVGPSHHDAEGADISQTSTTVRTSVARATVIGR